jgi:hypothetical protein
MTVASIAASRVAMACPMPRPPPVTTATDPARETNSFGCIESSPLGFLAPQAGGAILRQPRPRRNWLQVKTDPNLIEAAEEALVTRQS